jgi:hypothetical protein
MNRRKFNLVPIVISPSFYSPNKLYNFFNTLVSNNSLDKIIEQAKNGKINLTLDEFQLNQSYLSNFIGNLQFTINNVNIIPEINNHFTIHGSSKDLFSNSLLNKFEFDLEAQFYELNGNIFITAFFRPNENINLLSQLPGKIGNILNDLNFIKVTNPYLILSPTHITKISTEYLQEYNNEVVDIQSQLSFIGFCDFDKSNSAIKLITDLIETIIGKGPHIMTWDINSSVIINFKKLINTQISIGDIINLKSPSFAILIQNGYPKFYISGNFELTFLGLNLLKKLDVLFDEINTTCKLDLTAEFKTLTTFVKFNNISFSNFQLNFSYDRVTFATSIGAEGSFSLTGENSAESSTSTGLTDNAKNQFKGQFSNRTGSIEPTFLYLKIEKLTLVDSIKIILPHINLGSFLSSIYIEKSVFYWCDIITGADTPDGLHVLPGLGFSGITNILGLKTFSKFEMGTSDISGSLVFSPINVGGDLLIISGTGSGSGTYNNLTIEPGGMFVTFSSSGNPYFSISAEIKVLGLLCQSVSGSIGDNGLKANIKSNTANIVKEEMQFEFKNNTYFDLSASIDITSMGLKLNFGEYGSIDLNASLNGSFHSEFRGNNIVSNSFEINFTFLNHSFKRPIAHFKLNDLNYIVDALKEIIHDLIYDLIIGEVVKWLIMTLEESFRIAGDKLESVGRFLRARFNQTIQEAAIAMQKAGYLAEDAAEALYKGYKYGNEVLINELLVGSLKLAAYQVEQVAKAIKELLKYTSEKIAELLTSVKYTAAEVAKALKSLGDDVVKIAGILKNTLKLAPEIIANALRSIECTVEKTYEVLNSIFDLSEAEAVKVLKLGGYAYEEIKQIPVLGPAVDKIETVLEDAWHTVTDLLPW